MFKKMALALSAAAVIAIPAAADAQYYGGYRHHSYRNYGYSYPRTTTVISIGSPGYGYYGGGYGYPAYGYGGYPAYNYGYGYPAYNYGYNPGYYGGYGYNSGYGYNGGYCGTRTGAGAAIGGVAGALLGSQAAGGHRYSRYGYRHRSGDRTAGALIGGVVGAAVGGAIASGNCY